MHLDLAAGAALVAVMASSALMSGLAGFGFSAVGATALWILPPTQAVPLLMVLSTANQILAIVTLRDHMPAPRDWWAAGPAPYVLGGLIGVKLGLWLLLSVRAEAMMTLLGVLLVGYAAWGLLPRPVPACPQASGWRSSLLVGLAGGAIGGFSAFPGAAVVVWTGLRGLPKLRVRAIVQPYILSMQIAALAMLAVTRPQIFDRQFLGLLLLTLPFVLPLTATGVRLFHATSEKGFRRIVLLLIALSGSGLLVRGLAPLLAAGAGTPGLLSLHG